METRHFLNKEIKKIVKFWDKNFVVYKHAVVYKNCLIYNYSILPDGYMYRVALQLEYRNREKTFNYIVSNSFYDEYRRIKDEYSHIEKLVYVIDNVYPEFFNDITNFIKETDEDIKRKQEIIKATELIKSQIKPYPDKTIVLLFDEDEINVYEVKDYNSLEHLDNINLK